jgi:hypothetical protein
MSGPSSLRTGRAVFPHPALQLAVHRLAGGAVVAVAGVSPTPVMAEGF